MEKGYACDGMFKLDVEMYKTSTSVYMFSSTNFWHDCLCHINECYVGIMSSLGLIPMIKKNFEKIPSDYSYTKNKEELNYLLSWSKGVLDFYKYALKNQLNTIFTVDL